MSVVLDYKPPVDRLFAIGDPDIHDRMWMGYAHAFGIGIDDIPELIRLTLDPIWLEGDPDDPAVFGPLHAWRALGELRAAEAVESLLSLLPRIDETGDDWIGEDMPQVLAMIGPPALPHLGRFLSDAVNSLWARVAAAQAISNLGRTHPEARTDCIDAACHSLESFADNHVIFNAYLILILMDLKAKERISLIERAFTANRVDTESIGTLADVRAEFGLENRRNRPKRWILSLEDAINRVIPPSVEKDPDWMCDIIDESLRKEFD